MYRIVLRSLTIAVVVFGISPAFADDQPAPKREGEKPAAKRDGEKPAAKRDGENPAKAGGGDEEGIRAVLKSVDLKKGIITVVISGDGGTSVRTLNLAGKDIKVTGLSDKLTDLKEGVQVFLQLSAEEDVVAIRTAKARVNSKTGRIFNAYDKSGDGKVDFEEWLSLKEGVDAARRARERVYFDGADSNKDGTISFPEFENWMENRGRQPEAGRVPANPANPREAKE